MESLKYKNLGFFFPYSLCTFFQALHVACSIDLCDSSFTASSLAVQYPCLTQPVALWPSGSYAYPRNAVIYFSVMTFAQNKNFRIWDKTSCVKQSNEPNLENSGVVSARRRAWSPIVFHGSTTSLAVSIQLSLTLRGISQGWQVGLDSRRILSLTNYHFLA